MTVSTSVGVGGSWCAVDDGSARARVVDAGVNFIDTADVYGDGRSGGGSLPGRCPR
jgi:aryl-alcohol dehydrogenase-like predicted oxidoreductase